MVKIVLDIESLLGSSFIRLRRLVVYGSLHRFQGIFLKLESTISFGSSLDL